MTELWGQEEPSIWRSILERYESVIVAQGVASLPELDRWYRTALPKALAGRPRPFIEHAELVRLTEWKMARGVWRQRNLVLVRSNDPEVVVEMSTAALGSIPDPTAPISTLSKLAGVGPATASAVASAVAPEHYPFFDEIVAAQIPGLGPVNYTLGYYRKYSDLLRARAASLPGWSATLVERALWTNRGGKAGISVEGTDA